MWVHDTGTKKSRHPCPLLIRPLCSLTRHTSWKYIYAFHLRCVLEVQFCSLGSSRSPRALRYTTQFLKYSSTLQISLKPLASVIMSFASPDGDHLASFEQAMTNVLSTPLAEFTHAQIVDGMPTSDTYMRDHWHYEGRPAMNHHDLCPGTMEKTRAFRSQFDDFSVRFETKVATTWGRSNELTMVNT